MQLTELYQLVKDVKSSDKRVLIINDFDGTVSQNGPSGGKNPFDTILHPDCGKALLVMQQHGAIIGAISNRSGTQIARFYQAAGFEKPPYIMGTYGMELYEPEVDNPRQGNTTVDPRFEEYKDLITKILLNLRTQLLQYINFSGSFDVGAIEVELPSQFGPIFIENKAACLEYPAGLVNVYNLNRVEPPARVELVQKMDEWFKKFVGQISDQDRLASLLKIWGINKYGDPGDKGNYTWSIEPLFLEGKAEGMGRLFSEIEKREQLFLPFGLIMYAGDSDMDAGAMNEARNIANSTNHHMEAVGIWVESSEGQTLAEQTSDIQLNSVDEYAKVLTQMARVLAA